MENIDLLIYAVILNYNGYEDTKNCILSLNILNNNNLKIIVVDNYSPDSSGCLLKNEFPELEFIFSQENKGYAFGMNLGAKYAIERGADLILITNNDVIFTLNFFDPLLKVISSKDTIGIVSPKVLYLHDKNTIYCGGADFKISICGGHNPFQGKPAKYFANELRKITFAEGSCFLCKREVFEKVGFISEEYFMYFEDLDFSREVNKYYEIWYVPDSILFHKAGAGHGWSNFSSLYYFYYTRNRLIFFSKYNLPIKVYAVIFSLINSFAKTLVLLKAYLLTKKEKKKIESSINSLWKGIGAGLKIILNR